MLTNSQKVKMLLAMKNKTASWLADEIKMSRQNLANKISRNSLSIDELQKIAAACGCVYVFGFEFADGTKI